MANAIVIAGQLFSIDAKVVGWQESGWDATIQDCIHPAQPCTDGVPYGTIPVPYKQRYSIRPALRRYSGTPPLDAVKATIHQVIVHSATTRTAAQMFESLHNERGLSTHFLIDDDGTIYQTLDVALMAYHAGDWNLESIGIAITNRGDANKEPNFYGGKRPVVAIKINDYTMHAFDYLPAQYAAFRALAAALLGILPRLTANYPRVQGAQRWTTMPEAESKAFAGFLGQYHYTNQKWDPGPFDFARALPSTGVTSPVEAKQAATTGFPIGPWGTDHLWHGGLHLTAPEGAEVRAVLPGVVVAARSGAAQGTTGSVDFVLVRHAATLGAVKLRFYSLSMHLGPIAGKLQPRWMAHISPSGSVELLDIPVQSGEVIGYVGVAGPAGVAKPQLHLEIFSPVELFTELSTSPWQTVIGGERQRVCDRQAIVALAADDPRLRDLATYHVSEWNGEPAWADALIASPAMKQQDPDAIRQLVADQITPTLWWDARVAAACDLPTDGMVYHYHPLAFLERYAALDANPPPKLDPADRAACVNAFTLDEFRLGDAAPTCAPKP